ncbi:hypothetical protein LGV61_03390 [Desulfurispirillum indicum]|uniref:hypothetical protein n=1 Tax=Desulfurispirillum indicum TaxID=936456 RepID=UPI001CFA9484|nr:hypothetical protein [Desulfurispirillum indicum]UCZ57337.1 hypothetical protein LGV61_03390 [Desulfurispirillum indicum]
MQGAGKARSEAYSLYVAVTSDARQRRRWASWSSLLPDLQDRRAGKPEKRAFGGRVFESFLRGQKGQYPETKRGIQMSQACKINTPSGQKTLTEKNNFRASFVEPAGNKRQARLCKIKNKRKTTAG